MNDMIKAERSKILLRKPAKILFAAGIVLTVAYFFFFRFHYASVYYNYDTGEMDTVSGFAAVEQRREIAALFEGELTQESLERMQQKLNEAKSATEGLDDNSVFSAVHVYRDQAALLEYAMNADGSRKELQDMYPGGRPVILGYCDGWDLMLAGMGGVLSIIMCLFIVIALSPVFAEEYSYGTDSVIVAARYGRTKLTTAKVIASLETAVGIYMVYLLLYIALYGGFYGLDGWNVSIQSSLHYASSTYAITFLQMFLISVAFNILGIIALTVITLFFSAKMKSPVSALILSCAAAFLPVFFDFTESVPILQNLQEICPTFMLHTNGIFAAVKRYAGIIQPIIMLVFNFAVCVTFYALTKHTFKNHQVSG